MVPFETLPFGSKFGTPSQIQEQPTFIQFKTKECMISCAGDIIEWISSFAYVQCALRGLGFCDACSATSFGSLGKTGGRSSAF